MFELTVQGHIAAAHFLRGYEGKCQHLHGHTWKVEVILKSDKLNGIGMVADFMDLKKSLNEVLDSLDHKCLNDLDAFKEINPTTENLAKYIYERFASKIAPLQLEGVRVWESDTASVIYYE